MSYQLPPNLLRLFQPRPTLPSVPPLRKDGDPRKKPKKTVKPLEGVAAVLERVKQEEADRGQTTDGLEDGEEKDEMGTELTYAEQTKREIRREQRKKRIEESKSRGLAECGYGWE